MAFDELMDPVTCARAQVTLADAEPQLVDDVMVRRPKMLPADATVGGARDFLANPKVVTALLVDGTAFVGLLRRSDLPGSAPDAAPARWYAHRDVTTVKSGQPMRDALAVLNVEGSSRPVVLDDVGATVAGLLCLDLQRAGFCQG